MIVTVTCAGIPIGEATFEPAEGLAHARLRPLRAYDIASTFARAAALTLRETERWSPANGDFADDAASRWDGPRLALENGVGAELGVNNLLVLEQPSHEEHPFIRVVADFRPDLARVEAFLRTLSGGDGGRARPAA